MAGRYSAGISGLRAAQQAFAHLTPACMVEVNEATEETCIAIRNRAVALVPVRHGYLRSSIDWTINKKTGEGRVGLRRGKVTGAIAFMTSGGKMGANQSARIHIRRNAAGSVDRSDLIMPSKYGHLVEFGTNARRRKRGGGATGAIPKTANGRFMLPAAEAERRNYAQRVQNKGPRIEHSVASIGAQFK